MNYYLDNKLIAVGVIDLTEACLSSVYFFYDASYKKYQLGILSSLIEIEYVRAMNSHFPKFIYYYLGYYIHNCKKMQYKGQFEPAELLCPLTQLWVSFDEQLRAYLNSPEAQVSPALRKNSESSAIE